MDSPYEVQAAARWRPIWVAGSGPIALVAHCGSPTVTLHHERADAEQAREAIDQTGCGAHCQGNHQVVDLRD